MPGTHASGRPGGNPNITKYASQLPPNREEPFDKTLSVSVTASVKETLKSDRIKKEFGGAAAFVRAAIDEKLATLD